MSLTKRYLEDEVQRIADKHNEKWDTVMKLAEIFGFDLAIVDWLLGGGYEESEE